MNTGDQFLIYCIFVVLIFLLIVVFGIGISRSFFILRDKNYHKREKTLQSILSMILNHPDKKKAGYSKLKKFLKSDNDHQVLVDLLTSIGYNLSGQYFERAKAIYDDFKLEEFSIKNLNSTNWDKIVEAIIELSVLGSEKHTKNILPLLEHHNSNVRRQAKIAIVEIGKSKGLMQMEDKIGVMSSWTYISILSILHRTPFKLGNKELEKLQNSRNPSMRKLSSHLGRFSVIYQ
ncbi:HEAT repeat domain-containing protein [Marivirga salinae]|uniref:HEAT repeat domain-containing protein n=1 Tax=Marivirga salinarum TaxID=3059078 RepID=A0AA51N968_9BACT|nr:HEAT repeat domain-containing protein [Marivirga sp. BDSF4-3]WMN10992.1 HEAT repeat domain-containing protein [Marivirga sp. BDSF4-3]